MTSKTRRSQLLNSHSLSTLRGRLLTHQTTMAGGSAEPEYIGYRMPVFVAIFTFVEVVVVAVRFYARSLTARRFAADDGLVIASLLGQFVAGGIALGE